VPQDNPWARTVAALPTLVYSPRFSHCAWWFLGTDSAWVNPRAIAASAEGLHASHPLSLGFQWHQMGWSHGTTYSAGLTLYSRAALAAIAPLINSSAPCTNRTPADDFTLDSCGWAAGVVPLHALTVEPLGELGPGGSWSWQQPHHLMSWTAIHTLNPGYHLRLLWTYYTAIYGNGTAAEPGFGVEPGLAPAHLRQR
jgi:hypothetical protein